MYTNITSTFFMQQLLVWALQRGSFSLAAREIEMSAARTHVGGFNFYIYVFTLVCLFTLVMLCLFTLVCLHMLRNGYVCLHLSICACHP